MCWTLFDIVWNAECWNAEWKTELTVREYAGSGDVRPRDVKLNRTLQIPSLSLALKNRHSEHVILISSSLRYQVQWCFTRPAVVTTSFAAVSTEQQVLYNRIHNRYCKKWNLNQCGANELSVKSCQCYGSYLMVIEFAVNSRIYTDLHIHILYTFSLTVSFFLSFSPSIWLSYLQASHSNRLPSFLPSLSDLWSCQHFKSYWQSLLECLHLVIPLGAGCLLVHNTSEKQGAQFVSWENYEKKMQLFPNLPVYPWQSYRALAKWECTLWFRMHHILPIMTQIVLFSHSVFVLSGGLWIMMTVWKVSNREELTRKSHWCYLHMTQSVLHSSAFWKQERYFHFQLKVFRVHCATSSSTLSQDYHVWEMATPPNGQSWNSIWPSTFCS